MYSIPGLQIIVYPSEWSSHDACVVKLISYLYGKNVLCFPKRSKLVASPIAWPNLKISCQMIQEHLEIAHEGLKCISSYGKLYFSQICVVSMLLVAETSRDLSERPKSPFLTNFQSEIKQV